jgi:hypothetical protein
MRKPELTGTELQRQTVVGLPEREALSLVNANLALPINAALSANVLSDSSVAYSNAEQTTPVTQGLMLTNPMGG